MGYGWYLFHLHHSHVSLKQVANARLGGFPDEESRAHFAIRNLALRHGEERVTE